jgi:hypothetical protein
MNSDLALNPVTQEGQERAQEEEKCKLAHSTLGEEIVRKGKGVTVAIYHRY